MSALFAGLICSGRDSAIRARNVYLCEKRLACVKGAPRSDGILPGRASVKPLPSNAGRKRQTKEAPAGEKHEQRQHQHPGKLKARIMSPERFPLSERESVTEIRSNALAKENKTPLIAAFHVFYCCSSLFRRAPRKEGNNEEVNCASTTGVTLFCVPKKRQSSKAVHLIAYAKFFSNGNALSGCSASDSSHKRHSNL